ncbi:putative phage tail assembly chaperone [Seminibacterium arietis]|uniref:Phage tail assembly chaperone n=1 Tax=Seminibacterium arietis TaxID=1173502 RepID=A0ABW3I7S5_9PAST
MTTENQQNNAQALLEKLRNQNRQTATVIIDDSFELIFHRDDAAFELLQNEITENNKIVPVKDYLMAIVEPSQRDILTEILKSQLLYAQIVEVVNNAFIPKIKVELKN